MIISYEEGFLKIENGKLSVDGESVESHEIIKELGRGASGIVFLARNRLLDREEALKVWVKLREGDQRDKKIQGLMELRKLAQANPMYAVQVFEARNLKSAVIALMEYIPSVTLKEYVKMCVGVRNILGLAYAYIELINKTTAPETLHGDPHACNVLVCKEQVSKYETLLVLKLCDYGTSKFNKNADSGVRHWKTVWMTLVYITKRLPGSDVARAAVKEFKEISIANFNEMSRRPDLFSAEEMSRALSAFMRDYLSYWDYEWNFGG